MTIAIRPFEPRDQQDVMDIIVPVQRLEFGIVITAEEQPDLAAIPDFYQTGAGGFWVAEAEGAIVGTIGLKDIGARQAALRKMFVAAPYRGGAHRVGALLLERLLAHAREGGVRDIFLGTTDRFLAAHRFYEKNGFDEIAKADLPNAFPTMAVDTRFYAMRLVQPA